MDRIWSVVFGGLCALWFVLLPFSLIIAPSSAIVFSWPLALGLAPTAGLIARRKGRRRLAWALVAFPPAWIVLTLVVSNLARG